MEAIVLAGGLGTRLRSAVQELPKPMALVGGKPFLNYLMDYWISQGVKSFTLALGYKAECFLQYGENYRGASIYYSIEEKPLGTAGAMKLAAKGLKRGTPFVCLNGDTWFPASLSKLKKTSETLKSPILLSLAKHPAGESRYGGVIIDSRNKVISLESASQNTWINGGVYYIAGSEVIQCDEIYEESFEKSFLPKKIRERQVFGLPLEQVEFLDIGVPSDYYKAIDLIEGAQ